MFQGFSSTLAKESTVNLYLAHKHFAFCSIFAAVAVICTCAILVVFFFGFVFATQNLACDIFTFNPDLLGELELESTENEYSMLGEFDPSIVKTGFYMQGFLVVIGCVSYVVGLVIGWLIK